MRVSILLPVMVLFSCSSGFDAPPPQGSCGAANVLGMEVRAAELDAAPDGVPWDDDGTPPDVSVEFLCGENWVPTNVQEANAPLWPLGAGYVSCGYLPQQLADGVPFRVVDQDVGAREPLLDVPFVNIGEADFQRGTITVGAPGFPGSVTFDLETDGTQANAILSGFHVDLPTNRQAWDRDLSAPDVAVEVSCGGLGPSASEPTEALDMLFAREGSPYDGGFHPRTSCSASRQEMYRAGLTVRMWDVDAFEFMGSGVAAFPAYEAGTSSFPATGAVRRVDMALTKGHYACY